MPRAELRGGGELLRGALEIKAQTMLCEEGESAFELRCDGVGRAVAEVVRVGGWVAECTRVVGGVGWVAGVVEDPADAADAGGGGEEGAEGGGCGWGGEVAGGDDGEDGGGEGGDPEEFGEAGVRHGFDVD